MCGFGFKRLCFFDVGFGFKRAMPADVRKGSAFPSRFSKFPSRLRRKARGVASLGWEKPFGKAQPFRTSGGRAARFERFEKIMKEKINMKRIVCLCVILLCSISFAFAQGGRGRTTKKKPVVKKINPQIAEAEKAWIPFWKKFLKVIKERDSKGLFQLMAKDFDYQFGSNRQRAIKEYSSYPSIWENLEDITAKGATEILKKGTKIVCSFSNARAISKVSPNNWNEIGGAESENSSFLVFEFRRNRWFFVTRDFCEQE